jgi:hypothetical protein
VLGVVQVRAQLVLPYQRMQDDSVGTQRCAHVQPYLGVEYLILLFHQPQRVLVEHIEVGRIQRIGS